MATAKIQVADSPFNAMVIETGAKKPMIFPRENQIHQGVVAEGKSPAFLKQRFDPTKASI